MNKNVIAVGGLGGSGTRLVAEILSQSGIFIGDDLNKANDNLIFTRLFKNPTWYAKASRAEKEKRIRIFEQYMKYGKLHLKEYLELCTASRENPTFASKKMFYIRSLQRLFRSTRTLDVWGWKEPNTHILLKEILDYDASIKYVHVLRNGLDMVFSSNQQQLYNWGWLFGIRPGKADSDVETLEHRLEYWIRSTERILAFQKEYPRRIYMLNFSRLCAYPEAQIRDLLDFCGITLPEQKLAHLSTLPQDKGSRGRFKKFDLSFMREEKILFVEKMGFDVNRG